MMNKYFEEILLFGELFCLGFFFLQYVYGYSIHIFFLWIAFMIIIKYKMARGWKNTLILWKKYAK